MLPEIADVSEEQSAFVMLQTAFINLATASLFTKRSKVFGNSGNLNFQ